MPATFTAVVPASGEKVNLTFSASATAVSKDFYVHANGVVMDLLPATGSGTAWSLPLSLNSGWFPAGQTVKVSYYGDDAGITQAVVTATNSSTVTQGQQRYVLRGLGIFVTLSTLSWYTDPLSLAQVNAIDMPSYDMEQWFTSVIVPSGARYAVFATKHAGGFSFWPTAQANFNITQTAFGVAHPGADLCRDWVRLCRKYNIGVGFYLNWYDSWWTSVRTGHDGGYTNPAYITYQNAHLTELLSNYGKLDFLWVDSLGYSIGYTNYPYSNITTLRNSLQPNCLIVNNDHATAGSELSHSDIGVFEWPTPGAAIPATSNTMPTEFAEDTKTDDSWVWTSANENLFKTWIPGNVAKCRNGRCDYMINFSPNTSGLMPTVAGTYATNLGAAIGKRGTTPVVPALPDVRYGIDRGDGQTGIWGGGINSSAILGTL